MKRYVLGFAFTEDRRRVILIRKLKPEWQKGKWNGVGGKVEKGESSHQAMIREFEEETGVLLENWEEFAVMGNTDFSVQVYRTFDDECLKYNSFQTAEIVSAWAVENVGIHSPHRETLPNLKWLIPLALDNTPETSPENVVILYPEGSQ